MNKPRKSLGDDVISFIETNCVHTIGILMGKPLILDQWQKDFIYDMYLVEWDGERWQFVYTTVVLGANRGQGKSTLAAALALYALSPRGGHNAPRVIAAAASKDNAKHIYSTAVNMIELSPSLADMFIANKYVIICPDSRGEMIRISADGATNAGENPAFIIRDELWNWLTDKHQKLNEVLQTAKAKQPNCQSLTVTTAGSDKDSLLGKIYFGSMKDKRLEHPLPGLSVLRDPKNRFLFYWFGAPVDSDINKPETWRLANPGNHISLANIESIKNDPTISEDEFKRQYLGMFTKSWNAWFRSGIWESLASDLEIPKGARIQCSVDAAHNHDTTALTWGWIEEAGKPVVIRSKVWSAREEAPHDYFDESGTIDNRQVAAYIIDVLAKQYKVTEIAYDPKFFQNIARDLSDAGFTVVEMIQGSVAMKTAYTEFYSGVVINKDITHNGDEVLSAHIAGTSARKDENGWFVSKVRNKANDAAISAVMTYSRCRADLGRRNKQYVFGRKKEESEVTND